MGFLDNVVPFISQGLNIAGGLIGANAQERANMRLAKYQYEKDREMLDYQLDYNLPANQRKRLEDAGFNPNLFYGQGTPGNVESTPKFPDVQAGNIQGALADVGTKLQASRLMASQADLTDAKVTESGVKKDLMTAQKALVKANPYLNQSYVDAMVLNLESIAKMKQEEAFYKAGPMLYDTKDGKKQSYWLSTIQNDINSMVQKFDLGGKDLKVKAEIIQSKAFQNALDKIQVDWMQNAELTPQHVYTGIMLLLKSLMTAK